MILKLQRYQSSVQYKRGKKLYVTDTLARAPVADYPPAANAKYEYEAFQLEIAETIQIKKMKFRPAILVRCGSRKVVESFLLKEGNAGASKTVLEFQRREFRLRWPRLSLLLCYGPFLVTRRDVPEIHIAHQGASLQCKQQISRKKCLSCGRCVQYLSDRPREPIKSHTIPIRPWSKISANLFHLDGNNYLVMVDYCSYRTELDSLRGNTSANSVIRAVKQHFARHEIPDELITDNGPQFKSDESLRFAREYGFTMVISSPYYSRGNWEAESAVKIAKHILKKSWKEDPYQYLALLAYRNTLH